jgi:hypothetical protein
LRKKKEIDEKIHQKRESEMNNIELGISVLHTDEPDATKDSEFDNTSLMFNDESFDESVGSDQQISVLNLIGRELVGMRRLGLGLRAIRQPWFVGLARCPQYTGDSVSMLRVRPRRKKVVKKQEQGK